MDVIKLIIKCDVLVSFQEMFNFTYHNFKSFDYYKTLLVNCKVLVV